MDSTVIGQEPEMHELFYQESHKNDAIHQF
jgi:hypothetical protein